VYFTETASYRLNCLGWTAGDDSLVVVRGTSDGSRVDVVLVRPGHDAEIARGLKDVSDGSMTLDPRRRVVYFTRQIGAEHTLHALSLDTGVERVLFRGEPHGPSLSGIRVLADGRLLFSFQAQNHDIAAQQYAR
jgi:Tol biopolymer transport system component